MKKRVLNLCMGAALVAVSCAASAVSPVQRSMPLQHATPVRDINTQYLSVSQLPQLHCTKTQCSLVPTTTALSGMRWRGTASPSFTTMATPAAPNTAPIDVGPPAAQRFMFEGAGSGACQDLSSATGASPYEYMGGEDIPVPLGSTHITLLARFQSILSGGTSGAGSIIGQLEVKRDSGSTWMNVDANFAFTVAAVTNGESLSGISTYGGLVDLSTLPDGTGIPSAIDLRLIVYPLGVGGFTFGYQQVCRGFLQMSF